MLNIKSDIGIVGAGVMGSALALNISQKGFKCSIYDEDFQKIQALSQKNFDLKNVTSFTNIKDFILSL